MTATMGLGGFTTMGSRYSTSLAIRKPPTDTGRNLETLAVEAWSRWAVPKASFTKISP